MITHGLALPHARPAPSRSAWAAFFPVFLAFMLGLGVLMPASSPARADPKFPDLNNQRVVDEANLLTPQAKADLELKLKGLEDATTDQLVIVTLNSLDGYDIADYGYQLGRHWGIGQSGQEKASNGQTYKDNGILLIVAPNERKVRIEVGYGLEPVMTDAMSSMIIRNNIIPAFKSGSYENGIVAGTDAIIQQLSLDRGVAIQKAQAAQNAVSQAPERLPTWAIILVVIFVVFFARGWLPWLILGNVLGGGGRGGWGGGGGWSGGDGGGGFSGGGGSFGGGGSSGSW